MNNIIDNSNTLDVCKIDTTTVDNQMQCLYNYYNFVKITDLCIINDFPHADSLPFELYQDKRYNSLRRCKLTLFSHSLGPSDIYNKRYNAYKIALDSNNAIKCLLLNILQKKNRSHTEELVNIRDNICSYLFEHIPIAYKKDQIVYRIEKSCLNTTLKKANASSIKCIWDNNNFVNLYNSICYKVSVNIDPESPVNSNIIKKIHDVSININEIADLSSKDFCPDKYKAYTKKIDIIISMEKKQKFSELYRCNKCKKNQCTTERRYNRSLDEGVNLIINCLFCGNKWNA